MPQRHEIVDQVLALGEHALDRDQATKMWFRDARRQGGMRLTEKGLAALRASGLQSWCLDLGRIRPDKRLLIEMDHRMSWPYYINLRPPQLVLFSDRDAVMAGLYGDLRRWVLSLETWHHDRGISR